MNDQFEPPLEDIKEVFRSLFKEYIKEKKNLTPRDRKQVHKFVKKLITKL